MDDLLPPLLDFYYYKKGWKTVDIDQMSMQDGMVFERLLHQDEAQQAAMIDSIESRLRAAEDF